LAAEHQEQARMLGDLPWPGWRGCYVIFHVNPFGFLAMFEPLTIFILGSVQASISIINHVMIGIIDAVMLG
jgi:hypothetical protein